MLSVFPKDDPKQTRILKGFFFAFASYFVSASLSIMSILNGDSLLVLKQLPLILLGIILTNLYFYWQIRTGANKNYDDKTMTVPQLVVALSWMLFTMFFDNENRGLFLCIYIMIMMFGIFSLRRIQMLQIGSLAFIGYLMVVALDYAYFTSRFDFSTEVLRVSTLAAMLTWASMFAGYVSALREKLRLRNRDLSTALEEIRKLASHDDLTKIYNRRYIMDALAQEKARADRTDSIFSVVLLDIDHFKVINDRYGHLSGDRVLTVFTDRIKSILRGADILQQNTSKELFGRYGGEEFIVVLTGTALPGAVTCAERIRRVTCDSPIDDVYNVTLSAGVSQYCQGEEIEEMLRRADAALYEAKDRGRNRVVAEDHAVVDEYEVPANDRTKTNIVVGPFGKKR